MPASAAEAMARVTGRTGALPSISKNRTARFEGAIWSFSRVAARAVKKNQDKLSAKWDSQDRLSPAAGQRRGITLDTGLMTECRCYFQSCGDLLLLEMVSEVSFMLHEERCCDCTVFPRSRYAG